jgi:hypothetical protein
MPIMPGFTGISERLAFYLKSFLKMNQAASAPSFLPGGREEIA